MESNERQNIMFTGIITDIGKIISAEKIGGGVSLTVQAPASSSELHVGDSVSLNGACQTVVQRTKTRFSVVAVEETLQKTTLGELQPGSTINLELPMRLSDRLGGHVVLGHVDCVGWIAGIEPRETSKVLRIAFPQKFRRYVIPVGSIAVDGISLTIASVEENFFTVSIIPHTLEVTTLATAGVGTKVNLEFDVLGKYVESILRNGGSGEGENGGTGEGVTWDKLNRWGYDG